MTRWINSWFLALVMVFGLAAAQAQDTQIRADPTAPGNQQPQVLNTAGGIPQVNINTPNGNGLSYNRYQQFDVGNQGVILNNSNKSVNTQLGGWIERNPNIPGSEARLIVNEVNSSNPSHLGGFVEIAGRRADVVIANPSGINVDGGGFINANHATLTTGRPVIENGTLTGYRVEDGNINVYGGGLDARDSNYTSILSRAAAINAGIKAQNLNVVTGRNLISPDTSQVTRIGNNEETGVSLDVKALGGMYAGQIRLVGTGKGLGVNSVSNQGVIAASAGEVTISADGMLSSSGIISGQQVVRMNIGDNIANSGVVQSSGDMTLAATKSINNTGEILAGGDVKVTAGNNFSNDGDILVVGTLDTQVTNGIRNSGQIQAGNSYSQSATFYNIGLIDGGEVVIKATDIANVDTGQIYGDHVALQGVNIFNGTTVDTGHAPISRTSYDPSTNTYYDNGGTWVFT